MRTHRSSSIGAVVQPRRANCFLDFFRLANLCTLEQRSRRARRCCSCCCWSCTQSEGWRTEGRLLSALHSGTGNSLHGRRNVMQVKKRQPKKRWAEGLVKQNGIRDEMCTIYLWLLSTTCCFLLITSYRIYPITMSKSSPPSFRNSSQLALLIILHCDTSTRLSVALFEQIIASTFSVSTRLFQLMSIFSNLWQLCASLFMCSGPIPTPPILMEWRFPIKSMESWALLNRLTHQLTSSDTRLSKLACSILTSVESVNLSHSAITSVVRCVQYLRYFEDIEGIIQPRCKTSKLGNELGIALTERFVRSRQRLACRVRNFVQVANWVKPASVTCLHAAMSRKVRVAV